MKNTLKYIMITIVSCSLIGCYEDKGNYKYESNEVIEVNGLKKAYSVEAGVKELDIKIDVKSNYDADFQFTWEIVDLSSSTLLSTPDTIATTKDLFVKINKAPKTFTLVYKIKNLKTGYEKISTAILNVNTLYTRGWYILKDYDDKSSDIDFFSTDNDNSYIANEALFVENVLQSVNGSRLNGRGRQIRLLYNYGVMQSDGMFGDTKSIMATSDNDIRVTTLHDMKTASDLSSISYLGWNEITPDLVYNAESYMLMINNGKLHSYSTAMGNAGRFSEGFLLHKDDAPYKLSKYMIYDRDGIVFDEISCSFLALDGSAGLSFVKDAPITQLRGNNNNQECLFMGRRNKRRTTKLQADGYGIFKDKTTGAKILAYFTSAKMTTAFNIEVTKLTNVDKVNNAKIFALSADEAFLYMVAEDGDVWSRNLMSSFENREFDTPSDETITYIRHHKIDVSDEAPGQIFNLIAIASTKGKCYTVRFFEKNAGNLNTKPLFTIEGDGVVKDLCYVFGEYDSTWAVN